MKNLIARLEPFDKKLKCFNVVIETPKCSRVKYSYDFEAGLFGLTRALPEGMVFPYNFGFIPGTLAEDGDPLDILILNEEPLVCGCLLKARVLGIIKAEQAEKGEKIRNDRVVGVAIGKEAPKSLDFVRLDEQVVREIECFFMTYNQLAGKAFRVLGLASAKKARELIEKAARNHQRKAS